MLCGPLSVFTKIHVHAIGVTAGISEFVHFDAETFAFLGMYCLKMTLPLNLTITSSTTKCSEGL